MRGEDNMNNNRTLMNIKEDIKIITSNKLSISQSKLLFMGIMYEIILRKDLFPRKDTLKLFINNVFMKYFDKKELFKDYLYDSRSLLGARVQKKIQNELNYPEIVEMTRELCEILPNDNKEKVRKYTKLKMNEEVGEWLKFLSKERNNK